MKKLITKGFFLLILFLSCAIQAQEMEVKGMVTDLAEVPLSGASITIKGTSKGVVADFDGNYSINTSKGDVLIFSYLGYLSQEIQVNDNSTINAKLEEDAALLEEVVVVGFGIQKRLM